MKPKIVVLCGSTRFREDFERVNAEETMKGHIVLSVGFFHHQSPETITAVQKSSLDDLHKRKIDLADEVFVINKDNYIGSSTFSEIQYAGRLGKPIKYMENLLPIDRMDV